MQYKIIAPTGASSDSVFRQKVLQPFAEPILSFIDALSGRILKDPSFKHYPEVMAMAFWMRRANIVKLREEFEAKRADRTWLGRGVVFHIAPANVDTIFIYSWFLSMLVGNINVVRVSSQADEQLDVLLGAINEVVADDAHEDIRTRFMIVQYEHDDEITGHFSSKCHTRVIWGGDETIRRIRAIPIRPSATELVFADKFSFGLIDARSFLDHDKKDRLLEHFYNDAYWFSQNACSSPRMVVWIGEESIVNEARSEFWKILEGLADTKRLGFAPAVSMNKLIAECSVAIAAKEPVVIEKHRTSLVNRVLLSSADDINRELQCGGGLFYELRIDDLKELADIVQEKDQTIVSFGTNREALAEFVRTRCPIGVSRIVPFGEALTFSAVWDGYDLLREFCREIDITVR
ncbi:acyl-CoA reductase [bacterium]|nr:acyl-CoA reductase [bacterium]